MEQRIRPPDPTMEARHLSCLPGMEQRIRPADPTHGGSASVWFSWGNFFHAHDNFTHTTTPLKILSTISLAHCQQSEADSHAWLGLAQQN